MLLVSFSFSLGAIFVSRDFRFVRKKTFPSLSSNRAVVLSRFIGNLLQNIPLSEFPSSAHHDAHVAAQQNEPHPRPKCAAQGQTFRQGEVGAGVPGLPEAPDHARYGLVPVHMARRQHHTADAVGSGEVRRVENHSVRAVRSAHNSTVALRLGQTLHLDVSQHKPQDRMRQSKVHRLLPSQPSELSLLTRVRHSSNKSRTPRWRCAFSSTA